MYEPHYSFSTTHLSKLYNIICALEVSHEDLHQVRPTLDSVGRKVFQPCSCRIGQEQWKVVDNEIIIIHTTGLVGKPIILEP